jgi:hypothetical protein
VQDIRLALRTLRAQPGYSVVAILTLTLGIAANTAVFTVVNAVLLAPLPYDDPDDVVILNEQTPQSPAVSVTRHNYEAWRDRAQSFSAMAAFRPTNMTLTGLGEPERLPVKMIAARLLPLLGVRVQDGRGFTAADDRAGAEGVALLSAGFTRRRFGGERPLGRTLRQRSSLLRCYWAAPPSWRVSFRRSEPRGCRRWRR